MARLQEATGLSRIALALSLGLNMAGLLVWLIVGPIVGGLMYLFNDTSTPVSVLNGQIGAMALAVALFLAASVAGAFGFLRNTPVRTFVALGATGAAVLYPAIAPPARLPLEFIAEVVRQTL